MDDILPLFAVFGTLAVILASISLWSRRKVRMKVASIFVAALFLPACYACLVTLLGRPKPLDLEFLAIDTSEANVAAVQMEEGEAIYLWLNLPGVNEPRAYVLPWDEQMARQLHQAGQEAEGQGTNVRMRMAPSHLRDQSEQVFYAAPQEAPPPKQRVSVLPDAPG